MNTVSVSRAAGDGGMSSPNEESSAAWSGAGTETVAGGERKIRLLVFTRLYPNTARPLHGRFVEERLRHLVAGGKIDATVVAPVPWFPFRHRRFGAYATFARVPEREERHGIRIFHPRYPVIPKIGMSLTPQFMYRTVLPAVRRLLTAGSDYDVIDAHYFYPDGVAAVHIGRHLDKPVIVTARGTDVTWIPRYRLQRRQILNAAVGAAAIICVSRALSDGLARLGVASDKIVVLRNGVDLNRFSPMDRSMLHTRLNLRGPVWLAVGSLIQPKGVNLTITALAGVPEATLLIVGGGPEERNLRQLTQRLGMGARVRFLGPVPHDELVTYYNAADVLVLASRREGMPNVVLEALACGTPVIVTPFDGAREVVSAPEAGRIADSHTADAISAAWRQLQEHPPGPEATRRYAARFGWGPTVKAQEALYANVLGTWQRSARHGAVS